jgi:hypothetical protein
VTDAQSTVPWRDRGVVVMGSAVAGVGAFVFVLLATRSLGLEGFSPISQLWTVWAIAAAVVTFSTQVVTVRREVLARESATSLGAERVPLILLLAFVVPVLFVFRGRIFGDPTLLWPIIGSLIPVGSYATGKARGWLAVHGSPLQLAGVIGGENLVRCLAGALLALIGASAIWYGAAILMGYAVALLGLRPGKAVVHDQSDDRSVDERWLPLSASAAGICDHLLLVAAPTVLATSSGDPAVVSALFVSLAVFRAPYQFILGIVPSLTRDLIERIPGLSAPAIRHGARRGAAWVLTLSLAAGAVGLLIGESVVAPIFGGRGVLESADHALAAALTVVATGALLVSVAHLALGWAKPLMVTWVAVASVTFLIAYSVGSEPTAVVGVMLVGASVALSILGIPFATWSADNESISSNT